MSRRDRSQSYPDTGVDSTHWVSGSVGKDLVRRRLETGEKPCPVVRGRREFGTPGETVWVAPRSIRWGRVPPSPSQDSPVGGGKVPLTFTTPPFPGLGVSQGEEGES